MATRNGPLMPPGSSSGRSVASTRSRGVAPSLACNLCQKPLATTCFKCACDCIFCEDCTYSHFEQSSQCPTCRRTLNENDFLELVVANDSGTDIVKTTMQCLFSKKGSSGNLHFADLCQSLVNELDTAKVNAKFILKQLLVHSHKSGSMSAQAARAYEAMKAENTQMKQQMAAQRLQYEQRINELENRLRAKESEVKEKNGMLDKFRKYHGGGGGGGGGGGAAPHMVPHSSNASLASGRGGAEPPLRGLMAQREKSKQAQLNAMQGGGKVRPFMNNMNRRASPGNGFRPFSSSTSSGGSMASSTNRIRDLSANAGYHFSGMSNQNMNRRRRGGTPNSQDNGTPRHAMSPNTAFALNQGPHARNVFHHGSR